jgi:hypothetical protein
MTITHTAFFGDREREFRLTPKLVQELERLTGAGLGELIERLIKTRRFYRADVVETIRLGLIGGGASPKDAATLINVYVDDSPLDQSYILATAIVSAVWFGANWREQLADSENIKDAQSV